jgi:hypothetical protein
VLPPSADPMLARTGPIVQACATGGTAAYAPSATTVIELTSLSDLGPCTGEPVARNSLDLERGN